MRRSVATSARAWFDRLWAGIAARGRAVAPLPATSAPPLERARMLALSLLSERGEASSAALAGELLAVWQTLDEAGHAAFETFLAENFNPDPERLAGAAKAYLEDPTPERAMALFEFSQSPRQEFLQRMNMAPGGTAALVDMRREIHTRIKAMPALRLVDADLRHLLTAWFNRGFLELRRIDWDTPAVVLEQLIAYEAVHEIAGWDDLRRRLAPDRRCFAFFHPALANQPLIFVEVALVKGLASEVQPLLAPPLAGASGAEEADTAIFYSISNCLDGLRGISFGNFLIKQVVEELQAELPGLRQFATLSPVPGLRHWLARHLKGTAGAEALTAEERDAIARLVPEADATNTLALITAATEGAWWTDAERVAALHEPLIRLCAQYLTRPNKGLGAIDPVARFHLRNGALLERVNWLGNLSARGMKESCGIMVNYLYDPERIEVNHETFVRSGTVVRSPTVEKILRTPPAKKRAG